MTSSEIIERLGLQPHPEGGHFREIYRSGERVLRADAERSAVTSIHFLLEAGQHSRWHVLASDEVWHFLEGEPLELITYDPVVGRVETAVLGPLGEGLRRVRVVKAGHWQAARPKGAFTLVGCTVGPGFEFEDFRFVADVDGHEVAFEGPLAGLRDLL